MIEQNNSRTLKGLKKFQKKCRSLFKKEISLQKVGRLASLNNNFNSKI